MGRWFRSRRLACSLLICAAGARAQGRPTAELDREFRAAVAQYDAGKFDDAAARLETLVPNTPKSFEVHELLGLTYAAQSKNAKALEQLKIAVRLKPESAEARTNLAASLTQAGQEEPAGEQFRKARELAPRDYATNHNLGEFYIQAGKIAEATPLLETAQRLDGSSYENGYDLALAYLLTGRNDQARQLVQALVREKNTGELHNLLGQIEEKDGKFVAAANEYETAARMDPSEENLFSWGSELLLHRTYDPAITVFRQATERYPKSPRLMIGLGMALYWRGEYDGAVQALLAAAALNPTDARCYLFLSKSYDHYPDRAEDVIQVFRRYAELEPRNALAQYYYAMSLWKGKTPEDASVDLQPVEALLQKSIGLNGAFAEAHFQLGTLYTDRHEEGKSFTEYSRALELDPDLSDAHYRLGQYYVHAGEKDHAQKEFDLYQQLRSRRQAALDKEAAEVQQFVYAEKPAHSAAP